MNECIERSLSLIDELPRDVALIVYRFLFDYDYEYVRRQFRALWDNRQVPYLPEPDICWWILGAARRMYKGNGTMVMEWDWEGD
jgi:hypothetical protein